MGSSLCTHRGSLLRDGFNAESGAVVLAEVVGWEVVVALFFSEVMFCRLDVSFMTRDLVEIALITVRTVLPQGNSAVSVKDAE